MEAKWHVVTANFEMLEFAGFCTIFRKQDLNHEFRKHISNCGAPLSMAVLLGPPAHAQPKHPPPPPPPVRTLPSTELSFQDQFLAGFAAAFEQDHD